MGEEGGKGTHHSWNPSTQTGSLQSPRGTQAHWCAGTSLHAEGTESHRMCTWGGACRAASGSHCCYGANLSETCGQNKDSLSTRGRIEPSTWPQCHPLPVLRQTQRRAALFWLWGLRVLLKSASNSNYRRAQGRVKPSPSPTPGSVSSSSRYCSPHTLLPYGKCEVPATSRP